MKLTQKQLHGVREWLKMDRGMQPHTCPFGDNFFTRSRQDCDFVCPGVFKYLEQKRNMDASMRVFCPCKAYPLKYVVRVARLLLGNKGVTK
jgi:hypothetical protein